MSIANIFLNSNLKIGFDFLSCIGEDVIKYGKRCLIVCTNNESFFLLRDTVEKSFCEHNIIFQYFHDIKPNPYSDDIEKGIRKILDFKPDFLLAIGGGSTIDSAKAMSFVHNQKNISWDVLFEKFNDFSNLDRDLEKLIPVVAIPTTAGTGSHVTQAAVITHNKMKQTLYHQQLKPCLAFLDISIHIKAPITLRRITGFDAFSHAFESYISPMASPISKALSIHAIKIIMNILPHQSMLIKEGAEQLVFADSLAGLGLSIAGGGIPHPLSELLASYLETVPHGVCLSIFYPAYLDFLIESNNMNFIELAKELHIASTVNLKNSIINFINELKLNKKLEEYGLNIDKIQEMCKHPLLNNLPWATREALQKIIKNS